MLLQACKAAAQLPGRQVSLGAPDSPEAVLV